MIPEAMIRKGTKEFFRHWGSYILLIFSLNFLLSWVITPLLRWSASQILALGGVPYLTLTNLLTTFWQHPFVGLGLLVVVFLLVLALYLQFAVLLYGITMIRTTGLLRPVVLLRQVFGRLKRLPISSLGYFALYFFLITPFAALLLRSSLLAKITIPDFIIDFLTDNLLYTFLVLLLFATITYLGTRFIYFLPQLIVEEQTAKQAFATSWQQTKKSFWHLFGHLVTLNILTLALTLLISATAYLAQTGMDQLSGFWPLLGASFNLSLIEVFLQILTVFDTVLFLLLAMPKLADAPLPTPQKRPQRRRWVRVLAAAFMSLFALSLMLYNGLFMTGSLTSLPLAISHRGVNGDNGVQNTIPAMADTIKAKPDYIEMDLHETKDHQFVVMHDENLKNLAGVDKAPHELTLAELTQLTVQENGHSAKIPSFDEYLAYADAHQQKLLIEIKTTPQDSPEMLDNFIARYQEDILAHGHRIHSLDYQVVTGLKQKAPQLFVSFILPYNFVYPQTPADAYTMEQTTIDEAFLTQARRQKKEVYIWTVNETEDMDKLFFMDIDGIITDDLSELQKEKSTFNDDPSYSDRMMLKLMQLLGAHNASEN